MRPPDHFETDRLAARKPAASDAPAVFDSYAQDPQVTTYLSWPPYTDASALATFLQERATEWENPGAVSFSWLLSLRGPWSPIGAIGLTLQQTGAVIGYVLSRGHWGQGLIAEALRWVVEWSLAQPQVYRAWAFCHVDNLASSRVMEKAGLTREGVLRRWQRFPNLGGEPHDCFVYAKTR